MVHSPKINPRISVRENPWGWLPQEFIQKNLATQKKVLSYTMLYNFRENEFRYGCETAYYKMFETFHCPSTDFLDKKYTTPQLAIVLNDLKFSPFFGVRATCPPKPQISDIEVLDIWQEREYTSSNHKILGLWNFDEAQKEFLVGVLGPESADAMIRPHKKLVSVLFTCYDRQDVWIFEKDLKSVGSDWQISNMNQILI
jgi:hypothetical protein